MIAVITERTLEPRLQTFRYNLLILMRIPALFFSSCTTDDDIVVVLPAHKMLLVCQQTHLQLFNKTSTLLAHLPNSLDLDQEYCHIETQSFNHSTKNSAMKTPSQIAATHNLIQNKMSKITAIYRWVCLYFKMIVTQMAFHAELVNRSRVVHSDLGLLSVVSDAHRNVLVAAFAPDVIRHLKPSQTNTLLKQNNIVLWPFPR